MKQKSLVSSLERLAGKEANIWVTVVAVLFVILMAWLWNTKIAAMVSDAAGLNFGKTGVTLVGEKNRPYLVDFISVEPGTVIQVGFRSQGVRSCNPSWRPVEQNTKQLAPEPYTASRNITLTVKCVTTKGAEVSDSLQITTGVEQSGDFAITKPSSTDIWELGKTYEIVWDAKKPICGKADLGCDANPIDSADLGTRGVCENPSSDCSKPVINCVKAPCTEQPYPTFGTVTIALNQPQPPCVYATGKDKCYIKQLAPLIISADAVNTGSYQWTIPQNLESRFWGKQQITITNNANGTSASSATFSIVQKGQSGNPLHVKGPNGGEQWAIGQSKSIDWGDTYTGTVKIVLHEFRNCTQACTARVDRQYVLAEKALNTGSFAWVVGKSDAGSVTPGQYTVLITNSRGETDESDAPFTISASSTTDNTSGIEGIVTYGPTCGGPIRQDQKNCEDKPYKATIIVSRENGQKVTSFTSGADGRFRVDLAPGTYVLTSGTGTKYPAMGQQTVTVSANKYTNVTLTFDSGIR